MFVSYQKMMEHQQKKEDNKFKQEKITLMTNIKHSCSSLGE